MLRVSTKSTQIVTYFVCTTVVVLHFLCFCRNRFESQLTAEREATLRYKGENGIMKKKFTVLTKDIEDQKVNASKAKTSSRRTNLPSRPRVGLLVAPSCVR